MINLLYAGNKNIFDGLLISLLSLTKKKRTMQYICTHYGFTQIKPGLLDN